MTKITKRDLENYGHLRQSCLEMEQRRRAILDRLLAPKPTDAVSVSGGGQGDPLASAVAERDKLARQMWDKLEQMRLLQAQIEEALEALPEEEARLIRLRYYDRLSWRQVARKMHFSERQTYRVHGTALRKLATRK